jgi:hypothetical protein
MNRILLAGALLALATAQHLLRQALHRFRGASRTLRAA